MYYAKEAHCYILEVWMSFGIAGILSYIFIIAITIQNVINLLKYQKDDEYRIFLSIFVGISIITIHSLMDFDMSYLIIEMIFYMFIAIMNKDDKIEMPNIKMYEIIITIVFIPIAFFNILGFIADIVEDTSGITSNKIAPWISRYQYNRIVYIENNNIQDENKIKYIKNYIKNEPYNYQNIMYEIMSNQIIEDIDTGSTEENTRYLINIWKNVKRDRTYEIEPIQKRAEIMLNLAEELIKTEKENLITCAKEILQLIVAEYPENREIILDYRRNRETETITKFKDEYYTNVYDDAIKLLAENI